MGEKCIATCKGNDQALHPYDQQGDGGPLHNQTQGESGVLWHPHVSCVVHRTRFFSFTLSFSGALREGSTDIPD